MRCLPHVGLHESQRVPAIVVPTLSYNSQRRLQRTALPFRALDIARAHTGPIHLLITDVTMPEMDGREAARAITAMRPHCRVLFMSGYPAQAAFPSGELQPAEGFVQKPFVPRVLLQRVRELLEDGDDRQETGG